MRIIRPFTVDNTSLLSSNVPETPPAAYSAGTTYAAGDTAAELQADGFTWKVYESLQAGNTGHALSDTAWWRYLADTYGVWNVGTTYGANYIVISTTDNHAYKSLQAANTGHSLSDTAWWLDLGPDNRYAMFDRSNSSTTTRKEAITTQVQVTGRADAVSLLNIVGATVDVAMETTTDGVIYSESFNLVSDSGVTNWYEYFFEPIVRKGDLTIYDLPLNANPRITVTLNEPGDTASIGSLVIGQSREIGDVVHPSRIGIQDFSRKEQNEFGDFTIIERGFAKRATLKVAIEEDKVDAISALLAEYRATPVVFVGVEQYASTWIYGWYRDQSIEFTAPRETYLNLDLEGLT